MCYAPLLLAGNLYNGFTPLHDLLSLVTIEAWVPLYTYAPSDTWREVNYITQHVTTNLHICWFTLVYIELYRSYSAEDDWDLKLSSYYVERCSENTEK